MKSYKCDICNFSAKLKTDFNRHLNTIKHKKNEQIIEDKNNKLCKIYSKVPPKHSKIPPKPSEINSKSINTVTIIRIFRKSVKPEIQMFRNPNFQMFRKSEKNYDVV